MEINWHDCVDLDSDPDKQRGQLDWESRQARDRAERQAENEALIAQWKQRDADKKARREAAFARTAERNPTFWRAPDCPVNRTEAEAEELVARLDRLMARVNRTS